MSTNNFEASISSVIRFPKLERLYKELENELTLESKIWGIEDGGKNIPHYNNTKGIPTSIENKIKYKIQELKIVGHNTFKQARTPESIREYVRLATNRTYNIKGASINKATTSLLEIAAIDKADRVIKLNLDKIQRLEEEKQQSIVQMQTVVRLLDNFRPVDKQGVYTRKGIYTEISLAILELPVNTLAIIHSFPMPMIYCYVAGIGVSAVCFVACHSFGSSLKTIVMSYSSGNSEQSFKELNTKQKFSSLPNIFEFLLSFLSIILIVILIFNLRSEEGVSDLAILLNLSLILGAIITSFRATSPEEKQHKHFYKHKKQAEKKQKEIDRLKAKNARIKNRLDQALIKLKTGSRVRKGMTTTNINIETSITPEKTTTIDNQLEIAENSFMKKSDALLFKIISIYRHSNVTTRIENNIELPKIWDAELFDEYIKPPSVEDFNSNTNNF